MKVFCLKNFAVYRYLDGVSINVGYPHIHIWSYAVGYNYTRVWPRTSPTKTVSPPTFVKEYYYRQVVLMVRVTTHYKLDPTQLVVFTIHAYNCFHPISYYLFKSLISI